MRRIVSTLVAVALGACGGTKIPQHSGYKSAKAKPWAKAKVLKLNDKGEAKDDDDLSYPDMQRAKWYAVDVPAPGQLDLRLEITPPGDGVNEDFDLGLEILDPGNRVISKSDLENEEQVGELTKTKTLLDLTPGRYLIHLYLQGRLDTADYILRVAYKRAGGGEIKSDFPAQVLFLEPLPMVPLNDDTPRNYKQPVAITSKVVRNSRPQPKQPTGPAPTTMAARIIGVSVLGDKTQITIGRGTEAGASNGMKVTLKGVPGVFSLENCSATTCKALIRGTTDMIKQAGGTVTISP